MSAPSLRVAVLGGNGKTGRAVSGALEARDAVAVPIGRSQMSDLAGALAGCDAAYLIAPNLHPDEPSYVTDALDACRAAGVGRVVYHSVASPYVPSMPHHVGKAVSEDLVRRSALAWTILQPGAYLQNLDLTDTVRVPYRTDRLFGFADLPDVAEVAAGVLLDPGHVGATYELASVSATIDDLADAHGVVAEQVAWDGAGLDEREQSWLRAMFDYYDQHGLPVGTTVLAALLGR